MDSLEEKIRPYYSFRRNYICRIQPDSFQDAKGNRIQHKSRVIEFYYSGYESYKHDAHQPYMFFF